MRACCACRSGRERAEIPVSCVLPVSFLPLAPCFVPIIIRTLSVITFLASSFVPCFSFIFLIVFIVAYFVSPPRFHLSSSRPVLFSYLRLPRFPKSSYRLLRFLGRVHLSRFSAIFSKSFIFPIISPYSNVNSIGYVIVVKQGGKRSGRAYHSQL